jgi:hypothetical protein
MLERSTITVRWLNIERLGSLVMGVLAVSGCSDERGAARAEPSQLTLPTLTVAWSAAFANGTYSSPRFSDLTGDGVKDVVIGNGYDDEDEVRSRGGVLALDGRSGAVLWSVEAKAEVFGSAVFARLDGDDVDDIVIGGRSAVLLAISGRTGELLWSFRPNDDARVDGFFGFYNALVVPDVTGDGVSEMLLANGGDGRIEPGRPRPPGRILVFDGANGTTLADMPTPDGAETYMSPVKFSGGDDPQILIGTGGETHAGSLWTIRYSDVLAGRSSSAKSLLAPTQLKGFIAPPSLADLNGDGALDIVSVGMDGRVCALISKGDNLWCYGDPGLESAAQPAIGYFDGDDLPDVAAVFSSGVFPTYTGTRTIILRGLDGKVLSENDQNDGGFAIASPLAVDFNGDGFDELLTFDTFPFDRQFERTYLASASSGWVPRELRSSSAILSGTPAFEDIDNDGSVEFFVTTWNSARLDSMLTRFRLTPSLGTAGLHWSAYQGPFQAR